ncbi:LamG-like jellyroll fold domain-containing protein [uncultured Microscilla sp.]|uniref:LamG-like jellyroll fold domain-containing protein n=1 Tax=uncultured Microscilla sp. TaxID=432653 RepID=UPI00260CFB95|nr:LamG-like jellyroll fold domain-containing protein [uncultured Microscilla sp.]
MKQTITKQFSALIICLLAGVLLGQSTQAQTMPGVMHLPKNEYTSYVNLGVNLQSDLIAPGVNGEATLEFWIKSTQAGNEWTLTDMSMGTEHFKLYMHNEHQLNVQVKDQPLTATIAGEVTHNLWHHIALVVFDQGRQCELYVNGVKKGHVPFSNSVKGLYFQKKTSQELFITEIRAWDKRRTAEQIAQNQWRSVIRENLTTLKANEGLRYFYGTDDQNQTDHPSLPRLKMSNWQNAVPGFDAKIKAVGKYDHKELAIVKTNTDHPVLDNQLIQLTASKGAHEDKVRLHWLHVKGADGYHIFKNGSLIDSKEANGLEISSRISFDDADVLPQDMYAYEVKGYSHNDPIFKPSGVDQGFIFPNGKIIGTVKSREELFIEHVALSAKPVAGSMFGHALEFKAGATPIKVKQIEVFRNLPSFTLEFWYKGTGGNNTIFALDNTKVQVEGARIQATHHTGDVYIALDTNTVVDNQWHHYAITFSANGGRIYVDGGKEVIIDNEPHITANVTNTTPYFYDNLGVVSSFSFNAKRGSDYSLDEVRLWNSEKQQVLKEGTLVTETDQAYADRLDQEIHERYTHVISGNEPYLLLYYRFDLGHTHNGVTYIFNQAQAHKGSYIGAGHSLHWLAASEQPRQLKYGTFTNDQGYYELTMINTGKGANAVDFTVTPYKINHVFDPTDRQVVLKRSLTKSDYIKTADFIDESTFPLAGHVLYKVDDKEYPVPVGQQFTLGGNLIQGDDPNFKTDHAGAFSIGGPIGKYAVAVYNPFEEQTSGTQTLAFDGIDDYVVSEKVQNFQQKGTWSGWVKRRSFPPDSVPALQTILQVGKLRLVLKNNESLQLMQGNTVLISSVEKISDDWTFFAFTFDQGTSKLTLHIGAVAHEPSSATPGVDMVGRIVLGAHKDAAQNSEFFKGNLHLIEYRDRVADDALIGQIREGGYISGDKTSLKISYAFTETAKETIRTVSLLPNAHKYVLELKNGVARDEQTINPYTRKTKQEYDAGGVEPYVLRLIDPNDSSQYNFNVVDPVTDLRFYNKTRYGLVGNIVIPCGCDIGAWNIRVERTDIVSPKYEKSYTGTEVNAFFNDNFTIFTLPALMPGKYKVTLTNQATPSIVLESPIINLSKGWKTYEFEYRNPLQLTAQIVQKIGRVEQNLDSATGLSKLKAQLVDLTAEEYCTDSDKYILEKEVGYLMALQAFEQYNDKKCFTKGVTYKFTGDLGEAVAQTDGSTGQDSLVFRTGEPNFFAPHTRRLNVTVTHEQRTIQIPIDAYVTGTIQFNNDFTFEAPANILAVLHDPPGGNSSTSLSENVSFSFSENISHEGGSEVNIDFSTGLNKTYYTGYWAGVGGGALFLEKVIDTEEKFKFKVTENFKFGGQNTRSAEVSLNQTVSTSNNPDLPGLPSDVYVGYAPIIHVGKGKTLKVENCQPVYNESADVMRPDRSPFFAITHQQVLDVTIPNLELLKAATTNQDSIGMYQQQIDGWRQIVANNEQVHANAASLPKFEVVNNAGSRSFPESIAFAAGANVSFELTDMNSNGGGSSANTNTSISKDFNKSFKIFGALVHLRSNVRGYHEYEKTTNTDGSNKKTYSFELSDSDLGDQFDVLIRRDGNHTYATPVFKTVAGRSMCPVEVGTQPRQGLEITSDVQTGVADLDDQVAFNVTLKNTQVAIEPANGGYHKTYGLKVHDNKGAIIKYEGVLMNEATKPIVLDAQGLGAIKNGLLTIERNPASAKTKFENIPVVFYALCEEENGSLGYYESNVKPSTGINLVDTLYLSAEFHRPCVERIEVLKPTNHWVVNSQSDNKLDLVFKINHPDASMDKLLIEYATAQSNVPHLLEEIVDPITTLTKRADGYYVYTVDVSGLVDGEYSIRLVPQCGIGTELWRKQHATDWIAGSIFRTKPVFVAFTPHNGGFLEQGEIKATLDRPIKQAGLNSLNISLRGILTGKVYTAQSILLDQATDSLWVPDQAVLDLDSMYTVEFWVKPSQLPSQEVSIIEKGSNFRISLTGDGKINNGRQVSSQALSVGSWTHVAVVHDGNHNIKTYFDGVLVANLSQVPPFTTNDEALVVGKQANGTAFMGALDEIRVWNIARSDAQIGTDKARMLTGNEAGLQAYYVLDNNALGAEELRDFTAKTKGTKAVGVAWVEKEEAAPINAESVVQSVPIDVVLSGDCEIIIKPKSNFPDYYLEGAILTASIGPDAVLDYYDNKADATSWSFMVNKNALSWDINNTEITQPLGQATEFSASLVNTGGIADTYRFEGLPTWLTLRNKSLNTTYNLPGGFTHRVDFRIDANLTAGEHEGFMKAYTPQGIEKFHIKVVVSASVARNVRLVKLTLSPVGEAGAEAPGYSLEQNHPNPMSDLTRIDYSLPEAGHVEINIYSLAGQKINTLVSENQSAGKHTITWNRKDKSRQRVIAGVYVYELKCNGTHIRKRLIVK